jgi:tetratricopeptide (TPR) repeat protein
MVSRVYFALILCFGLLPKTMVQAETPTNSSATATPAATTPAASTNKASAATVFDGKPVDTNIVDDFNLPSTNQSAASPGGIAEPEDTNSAPPSISWQNSGTNSASATLAMAIYFATMRQPEKAEPMLVGLLDQNIPEAIQKSALFELGTVAHDQNDLPRAQSIYGQYLERWPADVKVPEILLRQGEIFRQMGLNDLALGKFYSVMTSALSLKTDQLAYYQSLVLQTQVEIAETHYLIGQFADAADFYSRLLLNSDPSLNRAQIQFRLIRSVAIIGRNDQTVAQAKDFIARYPDADQVPEVRYYLAEALKALGQNADALQQVLLCLREQKNKTRNNPEVWAYWQQRIGNEVANQLYREGDYIDSLLVYTDLSQLDSTPDWQVPVEYQMGITYEKLSQPQKAIDTYNGILARETELGTNATAALQAVFGMAHWRLNFIQWQTNAEAVDHSMINAAIPPPDFSTNLQTSIKP